jgi:glycerol-3-phosphate dehydrogenase
MPRDLAALTGHRFDLLVVGGGIHGLFAAYDAAARGLSVTLVEASDYGSGATFNHQRTIHGGLRALQSGNVRKARRQIRERRAWAVMAPQLVRPLPFLIGTYRFSRRSRLAIRLGFRLYDVIGRRRNAGVSPELHLPRAKLESAAATRRLFPGIDERGLSGGAVWYDYQIRHAERLTWCVALAAMQAGARLVNHVEAIAPVTSGGRVAGCRVRDRIDGTELDIEASTTLLAAGRGLGALHQAFSVDGAPPVLRAMNALIDRPARDIAVAAGGGDGRMLTAVPWCGHVLVGTHQSAGPVDAAEAEPPAEAIDALLAAANHAFPRLAATRGDIRLLHHGLVPAVVSGQRADLLAEPRVIRHAGRGAPGLLSLVGVKYTTARLAAAQAVDAVCAELKRSRGHSRTNRIPLPHADVADVEGRLTEVLRELGVALDKDVEDHLSGWYGTEATALLRHAAAEGQLDRLTPDVPVLVGEITYAVAHSQALTLADVVTRRTRLACAGHPGDVLLQRAAEIMAPLRGWTAASTAAEIAAVDAGLRLKA